ncbi:MAG: hypothetical protein ACI4RI_02055, partial [Ruminococcus sp.]
CVIALLMVVLIIIATYAWFSRNTVDDVKVNEIAFQGSSDLEVSLDDKEYAFSQTFSFNSGSLAQDITGDGLEGTFSRPTITDSEDNSTISVPASDTTKWNTNISGDDTEGQSSDYKIQKIYFRSKKAMTVYLGDGSQVLGAAEVNNKKLVGTSEEVGNKSTVKGVTNGSEEVSVSKDCVVGASRFAFLDSDKTSVQCLWIPRPNIFYETKLDGASVAKTIHGGTSSSDLSTNYNITNSGQAYPNSATHYYYTKAGVSSTATAIAGSAGLSTTSSGDSKSKLVTLTKGSGEYYKGSIYVVIWVEGCDAEARQAFGGGKFGATLRFVGIEPSGS